MTARNIALVVAMLPVLLVASYSTGLIAEHIILRITTPSISDLPPITYVAELVSWTTIVAVVAIWCRAEARQVTAQAVRRGGKQ